MSEVDYEAYYNTIYQMDPYQLQPFRHDVFRVRDDDDMKALEESVKANGIMTPILAFWNEYGNLEVISGHRRIYVAKKLEFHSVPVIIKSVDMDQAVIIMTDSNLNVRTSLLPSEKAKAYKIKLDVLKHQGQRNDLTSGPVDQKLEEEKLSREAVAESVGESSVQVRRYIRLNDLNPELVNLVDDRKMGLRPAVELSYLPKEVQSEVFDYYKQNNVTPSHAQTREFRRLNDEGTLDSEMLKRILDKGKPNQKEEVDKMVITSPDIFYYLKGYTSRMEKELRIIKALKLLDAVEKKRNSREERQYGERGDEQQEQFLIINSQTTES